MKGWDLNWAAVVNGKGSKTEMWPRLKKRN